MVNLNKTIFLYYKYSVYCINMFTTFLPSEMTKDEAIDKLQVGASVRRIDNGEEKIVSVAPDPTKESGRFGVGDSKKRNQNPVSWSIAKAAPTKQLPKTPTPAPTKKRTPTKKLSPNSPALEQAVYLSSDHQQALVALMQKQAEEMDKLKEKLQQQHQEQIQELEQKHKKAIRKLKKLHMQKEKKKARSKMEKRHSEQLQQLKKNHVDEMDILKTKQDEELRKFDANIIQHETDV